MQVTCFGVIPVLKTNDGYRVLLVQHQEGHWSFPKGHAQSGESEAETALRELREETGITDCILEKDERFLMKYEIHQNGRTIDKTVVFFIGHVKNDRIQIDQNEIRDFKWTTWKEALTAATFPESRALLDRVMARLGSA